MMIHCEVKTSIGLREPLARNLHGMRVGKAPWESCQLGAGIGVAAQLGSFREQEKEGKSDRCNDKLQPARQKRGVAYQSESDRVVESIRRASLG